jgi:hypothetical protein
MRIRIRVQLPKYSQNGLEKFVVSGLDSKPQPVFLPSPSSHVCTVARKKIKNKNQTYGRRYQIWSFWNVESNVRETYDPFTFLIGDFVSVSKY